VLTEKAVEGVPNQAVVAAWNRMFDVLEAYARHLASLHGRDSARAVEDSLGGLATQFKVTAANLGSDGGISARPAALLTEATTALLRAKARRRAGEVAEQADSAMRRIFESLAEEIGSSDTQGLRRTVREHLRVREARATAQFADATAPEERRQITTKFIDLLRRRDQQDQLLAALRGTFLTLADAHTALARGRAAEVSGAVEFIGAELQHTRELQERFTRLLPC
jgi:hypothetical protein